MAIHAARPRILVVEDELLVAADLEQSLIELGYDVVSTTETASGAVDAAERQKPDLVLMDIHLKGTADGIAAAEQIAQRWNIPVVFVTANTNSEVLARAKASGPYGYVIKPFRTQELNATVAVALHQHRRVQQVFTDHAWLGTVLASLRDGVIACDAEARIRFCNPAAAELTGWTAAETLGRPAREIFAVSGITGDFAGPCQLEKALATRQPAATARFLLRRKDGAKVPIEDCAAAILERGQPVGAVSIFHDITDALTRERIEEEERDRLEEEVEAAARELGHTRAELRALSAHLMHAQEEQSRRLARELHDGFGQVTALLEMQARRALDALPLNSALAEELLRAMSNQIAGLDRGLRRVSHSLHPSVLEDLGLAPALESLVQDIRRGGAEATIRVPEPPPDIPMEAATALYRIAQEALRNAAKHAPGAPVSIVLSVADGSVRLEIEDCGPGFELAQARASGGLGLVSMQERALKLSGTFRIRTKPGEGTDLTITIPLGK